MITTQQIAQAFENDLNELLDYENLSFKLWANMGKKSKAMRVGNTVQERIDGDIRISASSITANRLVMGVNQLTIEFGVPVDPPKTTTAQTAEDLEPVKNGQYWFVQYIVGILSQYFQKYQAIEMTDEQGVTYGVGIVAGVAAPQTVDLQPYEGNFITVNVYVNMNIVQGGIISLNVGVELDGVAVPFQTFTPDRTGVLDPSVYSGGDYSEVISTSSAFAAECTMPTNTVYASSIAAVAFLLHGDLNEAHFLKLTWGGEDTELYLVSFTRETGGIQDVTIASVTFRVAQVRDDADVVKIPDAFQLGYFEVDSSELSEIELSVSADCLGYIGGKAYEFTAGQSVTVPVSPHSIVYDESTDEYRVYLITSAKVTVTADGYVFEVQ